MDINKLTRILIWGGSLAILLSVIWWYNFYVQSNIDYYVKMLGITKFMEMSFSCLYSSSELCEGLSVMGQVRGAALYTPIAFWLAVAMAGIGIILKFSLKTKYQT